MSEFFEFLNKNTCSQISKNVFDSFEFSGESDIFDDVNFLNLL